MIRRSVTSLVVLGCLVVIGLVAVATWRETRPQQPASAAAPWQTPGQAGGGAPGADEIIGPVALSLADDGTLLRASAGGCTGDRAPSVGVLAPDSERLRVVTVDGLQQTLGVAAGGVDDLAITGLDAECEPGTWRSTDAGATWERGEAEPAWALVLADADAGGAVAPDTIGTPDGPRRLPPDCQPQLVSPSSPSEALVACLSGDLVSVSTQRSYGQVWTGPGLRAGVAVGGGRLLIGTMTAVCPAGLGSARISSIEGQPSPRCLARHKAITGLVEGDRGIFVQVGDDLLTLDDAGADPRVVEAGE